ncbi:microtubule-associated protein 2-like isoform X2 [Corythoichthys intestinalis]|uniref:microtubule-associated protein 2-like isoform X2 n=1 Tax=Corythoichthys intestinalis TaxID=161448 RepID=UPI0025A672F2|nr:microtubule-associated protein 2-like isoform X2 [Corythoichthys intestinalis]
MADDRQPEDGAAQWDASGAQPPAGTHGANGFSSSSYRTCQTGGTHATSPPFSARENGFNGELTGAHAITAEQVSARIVQEVTAEAVAVLKGEQESQRLPSVEDTTNLPPSPPPSPAAEQFGPLEQDVGDEEEAGPLRRFQNSRERCKFLAPSISVSVPEDDPYHSDEEYYEHPLFSPEWTHSGARPTGQAVAFRQIEEETMEALTAEYEEEVEEDDDVEEEEEEEESAEAALDEQQWSGEESDLDIPEAELLEKGENVDKAQAEANSAPSESSMDKEEVEGDESPETAVKMDSEKPGSEKSGSMSPDSIGSEKRPEEFSEHQTQGFFAGERIVPESPTADLPSFAHSNVHVQAKESAKPITLQPLYGEPLTVSEKQPSVEVVEFSSLGSPSNFSSMGVSVEGGNLTGDAMSAYFETSATDLHVSPQGKGEGYYELSRVSEEMNTADSKTQKPSSTVQECSERQNVDTPNFSVSERSNDCKLSPGKLALEQRSYSLNITIGAMAQGGQEKMRNFSPLATDILTYTSGSLDESADYLPITTPSGEKPPPFPPLILETAASIASDSSSPPRTAEGISDPSPEPESPKSPVSPQPCESSPKNEPVMAQDLPEMLDLAESRSRLSSENTDPEIVRRKSFQGFPDDMLSSFATGEQSPGLKKSDSQLEEMGYCVFSEYSGPMPSPADVISPTNTSTQVFTPADLEEKVAAQARKLAVRDASVEDTNQTVGLDISEEKEKSEAERKDSSEECQKNINDQLITSVSEQLKSPSLPGETFVTPTVTVTLEEGGRSGSETDQQASGEGSASESEIADYERQIRKLEMEDRPLSLEEERELQELREKVKLVHQEAYEEVDAEDVYQLTGVAKDRIARPVKTSPTSSVESNIDDDKLLSPVLSPSKLKQKELYGSPKRAVSPVLGVNKEAKEELDKKVKEPNEKEAEEKKEVEKEETEKKAREETEKKLNEKKEREEKEKREKEEAERIQRDEKEKEESRAKEKEEKERIEKEMKEKEREMREKEEAERIEKEKKEREEKEMREREEAERMEKEKKEREEKEMRQREEAERMEKEKKEREEKEMRQREEAERMEKEKKEKEEKEMREREEAERMEKERKEKEKEIREREEAAKIDKERKEKEERDLKEKEEAERMEKERKEKEEREMREREEAERMEKEKKEKEEREMREMAEKIEKERKEKEEREMREMAEKIEKERKEKEESEMRAREQAEKIEKERKEKQEREMSQQKEAERIEQERKEKEEQEMREREEAEKTENERKGKVTSEAERVVKEKDEQENSEEARKEEKEREDKKLKETQNVEEAKLKLVEKEQKEEELAAGSVAVKEMVETRAAIESVVMVEDDFITVVQTIDETDEPGHSVRFSAPPEALCIPGGEEQEEEEDEEEEGDEEESVELAQEADIEPGSFEEVCDIPETPASPQREAPNIETEEPTESFDRDETTMDDSILDSSWVDTHADDDKSMATEHIQPLPKVPSPVKTSTVVPNKQTQQKRTEKHEKPVKPKTKGGRVKGRLSTPERKPLHKEPVYIPREKKKAVIKKTECTKKMEAQTLSPSKRIGPKQVVRQTRPTQHHSCPRRRPTETVSDNRQPLTVARRSCDRAMDGRSQSPHKRSSMPRQASSLTRRAYHEHEDSSTSITSSGSTAPRRPTACRAVMRAEHRTGRAPSMTVSEPLRSRSARSGHSTPRTPGSSAMTPGTPPSCSSSSRTPGTPRSLSLMSHERRVAVTRTPPKSPATTPKQLRVINQPLPDFKKVRSKVGSIDNIKYQPKGGQTHKEQIMAAEVNHKASSWIWNSVLRVISFTLCLSAAHSMTWTQGLLNQILNQKLDFRYIQSKCCSKDNLKQPPSGGNVLIPSVKLNYSHVQSRCGSLDRRGYSAGGGNVHIQNKKIDLSHVTSKCGSLDNIHHRPGGGNVRIESVKLDFKDKAQAKVGSLDNAHHTPGGGRVTIESHRLTFRDHAKARVDHGADIIVRSPGRSRSMSPHRQRDSHLSSSGSLNMLESPQLATLAEDVTAALAKQGL